MVKKYLAFGISATLMLCAMSCSDDNFVPDPNDPFAQPGDRAETFEVPLNIITEKPQSIGNPLVNDIVSRAGEDDSETGSGETTKPADPEKAAEEALKDIWVLQYDENGDQLIAPRFYEVSSTEIRKLNIRLAEGKDSRVFVVANTCDPEWAVGKDFSTVEKFVSYETPFTEENVEMGEDEYLLMEGNVKETIRKESDLLPVDIHLTRMMAKISFKYVTEAAAANLKVTRVIINNMPTHMRMEETPIEQNYPLGDDFETRSVTLDKQLASGSVYTFYMPANRRGTNDNDKAENKNNGAPDKALYVQLFVTSETNGSNYLYTIYLGANDKNDFNVRRNHNYNISMIIKTEERDDDRVLAAPANCFVLGFNDVIMFDPYTRTETAGGWKYTDYVNKRVPEKTIKDVRILWQEQNVLGNNSDKSKVWLDEYNRVHVKSGSTAGNAVIAAYNEKGTIIWSWHIWVNNDRPAQISKAVPYKTYYWDNNGIYTSQLINGRALMQCNLGAKSATATGLKAYGTLYQWGRKDPIPMGWKVTDAGNGAYLMNNTNFGVITNNSNTEIPLSTDGTKNDNSLFFNFELTNEQRGTIEYTIQHPQIFIGACNGYNTSTSNIADDAYKSPNSWINNGDWYWGGEDKLWGGKPFTEATKTKLVHKKGDNHRGTVQGVDGWLSDNGAKEKSLFDPCPAGWMVPPADMWLSFTKDGLNSGWNSPSSYVNGTFASGIYGHQIYVEGVWHKGKTVYFPSQGFRHSNGLYKRNGACGNYHTSTPSKDGTVNCFHIHNASAAFPFEPGYESTRRAFAGPVRCVRDVD